MMMMMMRCIWAVVVGGYPGDGTGRGGGGITPNLTLFSGLPARLRKGDRFIFLGGGGAAAGSWGDAVEDVREESAQDALDADHLVPCATQILLFSRKKHERKRAAQQRVQGVKGDERCGERSSLAKRGKTKRGSTTITRE